jgi:hypothetical protein
MSPAFNLYGCTLIGKNEFLVHCNYGKDLLYQSLLSSRNLHVWSISIIPYMEHFEVQEVAFLRNQNLFKIFPWLNRFSKRSEANHPNGFLSRQQP